MAMEGTVFESRTFVKGRSSAINSCRSLLSTVSGRQASFVYGNKNCAVDVKRHQRRADLRAVATKSTAFGVMVAVMNGETWELKVGAPCRVWTYSNRVESLSPCFTKWEYRQNPT